MAAQSYLSRFEPASDVVPNRLICDKRRKFKFNMAGQGSHLKFFYLAMCVVSLGTTAFVLASDRGRFWTVKFDSSVENHIVFPPYSNRQYGIEPLSDTTGYLRRSSRVLLSKDIEVSWVNKTLSLLNPEKCVCNGITHFLSDIKDVKERERIHKRRKIELDKFNKRVSKGNCPMLFVKGSVPLSYPSNGLEAAPEQTISIPKLGVKDTQDAAEYEVQLVSTMGIFMVTATVAEVKLKGVGTSKLRAQSSSLPHLNRQLEFVVYTNTVYDFGVYDIVRFLYGRYEAKFPIHIRFKPVPILYEPGPDDNINNKVTIVTKTFLRYDAVRGLLKSIREFYPKMRVIVADDSRPIEDLQSNYTDHYVMPFAVGFFAGRNLAVSQVTTPYLLYVDDDFVFTNKTKIEKMVDVLDNTHMDIVSGLVDFQKNVEPQIEATRMSLIESDDEGYCLMRRKGWYRPLRGFPDCYETGRVINFFMGRVDTIRAVGFDPRHNRVGHTEFFVEGLGRMHLAACGFLTIDHKMDHPIEYQKFRRTDDRYLVDIRRYKYFRNSLNCWKRG